MENMETQIIPLIAREGAVAQLTKTRVHPFIRMKQWNLAISAHQFTMEDKKTILQGRIPMSLNIISKRMGKMMIPMGTILVVLQEGTGGRAHFITNISIQNNANLPSQYSKEYWQYDQSLHYGNKLVDS